MSAARAAPAPTRLSGWGANLRVDCFVARPESVPQLERRLDRRGTIPRGLGRSYGDPAINEGGQVLDMTSLDRYLAFDPQTGLLTCEAGTSLASIIHDFAPRGWFPMITPGTKFVTIGGCIANDVHGKAHHVQGSFSECVESMRVMLASGEVVQTSRTERPELFWASFGGMGLLGVITEATLRLRRIESAYFQQRAIVVRDLDELLLAFEENDRLFEYSVAWVDPLARGARLGRGVLTVGTHARVDVLPPALARQPLRRSGPPKVSVPVELPELSLNPLTLRMLNAVIERVQASAGSFTHYEKFFYPLDAIGEWYRGYGRRGFTQYQFVIPLDDGPRQMRAILETIARSDRLPFLNVLKKMGPASGGLLSFPFEGYTFAIDFPVRPGLPALLEQLDRMVLEAGGRIYLGKDSFCEPATFAAMYPQVEAFRRVKAQYDPRGVFTSNLARRLALV